MMILIKDSMRILIYGVLIGTICSLNTGDDRKMCQCSMETFQNKFCNHDFVILGKRTNHESKWSKFPMDDGTSLLVRKQKIKLYYNFKSNINYYKRGNARIEINFVYGFCGRNLATNIERHRFFIISGYYTKNGLLVTSCNIVDPVSSLSRLQIIGLYRNMYQIYCWYQRHCAIEFDSPTTRNLTGPPLVQKAVFSDGSYTMATSSCHVPISGIDCLNKNALCVPNPVLSRIALATHYKSKSLVPELVKIPQNYNQCHLVYNLPLYRQDFRRMPRPVRKRILLLKTAVKMDPCFIKFL